MLKVKQRTIPDDPVLEPDEPELLPLLLPPVLPPPHWLQLFLQLTNMYPGFFEHSPLDAHPAQFELASEQAENKKMLLFLWCNCSLHSTTRHLYLAQYVPTYFCTLKDFIIWLGLFVVGYPPILKIKNTYSPSYKMILSRYPPQLINSWYLVYLPLNIVSITFFLYSTRI